MTSTLTHATTTGSLRAVLLVDGVGTAALGAAALALAAPVSDHVASAGWLRVIGAVFVVAGLEMLLVRRFDGRRLAGGARALAVLDLAVAALGTAALTVLDATALGTALVLAVVATCLGMGTAKLALAGRLA